MAAGLGTRLLPYTKFLPKPVLPLMGIPVIQYALDQVAEAGVKEVVINFHHLPDVSAESLQALDLHGMNVHLSDERGKLLGSAGGVRKVLSHFREEPFYLINADTLCAISLKEIEKTYFEKKETPLLHMVLLARKDLPEKYKEIKFDIKTHQITGTGEMGQGVPFYAGVAIYHPKAFAHLKENEALDFFGEVFQPALKKKKVFAHLYSGEWFDIGSPRLWWETHLRWIEALDSNQLLKRWSGRVTEKNRSLSKSVWVFDPDKEMTVCPRWGKKIYWAGLGPGPKNLKDEAVLYGEVPGMVSFSKGIGFGGIWSDFENQ